MNRQKILFLADHKSPHTRRWAEWMARYGHAVVVYTLNGEDRVDATGMSYAPTVSLVGRRRLESRFVRIIFGVLDYISLIRRFRPDVIHAHSTGSYAWLTLVRRAALVIVTPWGKDLVEDLRPNWASMFLTKMALRRCQWVTTDGAHLVSILRTIGVPTRRIFRHEWGVDTSFFYPAAKVLDGDTDRPLTVISTRTLTPVHRVDVFIRACAQLQAANEKLFFKIVGGGSEMPALVALARELDIKNIEFCGMLNQYELRDALHSADIYVSTSPVDAGLSVSTAEAMACGLPIVHPDVADNASWTPGGYGGYLFESGNHIQLSDLLQRLARNPTELRLMGSRNRDTICSRNSMDKNMQMIEGLYKTANEEH
jgi:glycosyltransferase involved in cell wall biosynthesis